MISGFLHERAQFSRFCDGGSLSSLFPSFALTRAVQENKIWSRKQWPASNIRERFCFFCQNQMHVPCSFSGRNWTHFVDGEGSHEWIHGPGGYERQDSKTSEILLMCLSSALHQPFAQQLLVSSRGTQASAPHQTIYIVMDHWRCFINLRNNEGNGETLSIFEKWEILAVGKGMYLVCTLMAPFASSIHF